MTYLYNVPYTHARTHTHIRLEGKHYGTGADVFSFAIVMSELASLSAPYAEHLVDGDGKWISSWDQIVELTKKDSLRPTRESVRGAVRGRRICE